MTVIFKHRCMSRIVYKSITVHTIKTADALKDACYDMGGCDYSI